MPQDIPPGFEEVTQDIIPEGFEEVPTAKPKEESTFFSRVGEAAAEPFAGQEQQFQSVLGAIGSQEPADPTLLQQATTPLRRLNQGLAAIGVTGLNTLDAGVNVVSQLLSEATGAPREEIKEFIEVAGLRVGAAPRLSRGPRVTEPRVGEDIITQEHNLPQRVPLTRADVTQDVNLQSTLDEAIQGIHGERAKGLAQQVKDAQDAGLRGNIEEFQRAVTGRTTALTGEEAGLGVDRASQAIKIAAGDAKRAITDAYDTAKSLDASIEGDLVKSFGAASRKRLVDEGFDIIESPRLSKSLDEIEDLKLVDGKLSETSVNNLELWRKRVNKRIQSVRNSDPAEAEALRRLKNDYDEFSSNALDEGLIRGNTEAITAWKKARDLRTDFGKRFNDDATIKKIVNDNLTQEESVNLIFGGSQMGFKNQAGGIVQKMKSVLGEQSSAFKSLKEEAILRLVKNQSDSASFSGAKFNTAIEKAIKNNPTLMRELFTKEELVDLRSFGRFAKSVTEKKVGATNPSGIFNKLARLAQGAGATTSFVNKFLNPAFGFILTPAKQARAAAKVEDIINISQELAKARTDPEIFRRAIAVGIAADTEQE